MKNQTSCFKSEGVRGFNQIAVGQVVSTCCFRTGL
jgi:hypothetical protein